jgi:DNA-binding MarR family transcriptional regulator
MNRDLRVLYHTLYDLAGVLNRPPPGLTMTMMREAGISLDRALFQLLIRIERSGPVGIVALAELSDRDYTTISRQVAKLESLGLALRRTGAVDRRVREVVITPAGLAMTRAADLTREKLMTAILATWSPAEIHELARLCRRLVDAIAGVETSDPLGTETTQAARATAMKVTGSPARSSRRKTSSARRRVSRDR